MNTVNLPTARGSFIRLLECSEAGCANELLKLKKNMITTMGQSDVWENSTGCWLMPESIEGLKFEDATND